MKVLDQQADEYDIKQFAAEVEVLTNVKHPSLVQLFAYSTDGPQKCLVLECMDSSLDLRLVAKDKPPLGWEQRLQIALPVCQALQHLHSRDPPMIHRDIKSANVLLAGFDTNQPDDESVAKVGDFGTARADDRDRYDAESGHMLTQAKTHASTKQIVGTSPYMPAEYTLVSC